MNAPVSRSRSPVRKRWSMGVVAMAIGACLALYTFVRLHYAKPGRPHEPFAEGRQRSERERLRSAGWRTFEAAFERATDFPEPRGNVRSAAAQSPVVEDLFRASTENWHLPVEYLKVTAPTQLATGMSYTVYLLAQVDQARAQIVGFDGFQKGADIVLIPRWEQIPSELVPRDLRSRGRVLWPSGAVPPGEYRVTLLALKHATEWNLEVVGSAGSAPAGGAPP